MRLELHCHSTHSDGSYAPEQLAEALAAYEVELACLTDHDTMAGCEQLAAGLAAREVRVLRGLELSCKHAGRTIHLLVWGVGQGQGRRELQARLEEQRRRRRVRIVEICERLGELGIEIDPGPILARADGRTAGRPDVAKALVAAGVCQTVRESFDRFLKDHGPAYVPTPALSLEQGLALGRRAGARMGLAHPHTLRHHAVVRELFGEFRSEGLEGIEAFYGRFSPVRAEPWLRLARELHLIPTAGSDFHGDALSEVSAPGIEVPEPHAGPLREWLADVEAI